MFPKITLKTLILICCTKLSFALTLNEAIERTVDSSDGAKKIDADISSYKAVKFGSFEKVFLPSVSLGYNRENLSRDESIVAKTFDVSYNISDIYKGSLGFYGGVMALNSKTLQSTIQKNDLIISVISLYLDILESEKSIEVYRKSLESNEKMHKQIAERVNRGGMKPSSLYLIDAQTEEVKSAIDFEKSKLEIAKSTFFAKTNLEAKQMADPEQLEIEYKTLDDLLAKVKKENLYVHAIKSKTTASKYDLAYSSSRFLPDITLSYQKYQNKNVFTNEGKEGSKIVLSARFYLYKPGLISDVIQKGYEYRSAKFDFSDVLETKVNEARELWSLHNYYQASLKSKQKVVNARKMFVKDEMQDYIAGRAELTNTLNEETKLREAELDLIKSKFKSIINIYKIKNIAGEALYS